MNSYSAVDGLLHRLAFRTYRAHIAVADMEDHLYADSSKGCDVDRPVFITALPRRTFLRCPPPFSTPPPTCTRNFSVPPSMRSRAFR